MIFMGIDEGEDDHATIEYVSERSTPIHFCPFRI